MAKADLVDLGGTREASMRVTLALPHLHERNRRTARAGREAPHLPGPGGSNDTVAAGHRRDDQVVGAFGQR